MLFDLSCLTNTGQAVWEVSIWTDDQFTEHVNVHSQMEVYEQMLNPLFSKDYQNNFIY